VRNVRGASNAVDPATAGSDHVKIAVIGLGYVGLPLTLVFAEAGVEVVGIEAVESRCEQVNAGVSYIGDVTSEDLKRVVDKGLVHATTDYAASVECEACIICLPTPAA